MSDFGAIREREGEGKGGESSRGHRAASRIILLSISPSGMNGKGVAVVSASLTRSLTQARVALADTISPSSLVLRSASTPLNLDSPLSPLPPLPRPKRSYLKMAWHHQRGSTSQVGGRGGGPVHEGHLKTTSPLKPILTRFRGHHHSPVLGETRLRKWRGMIARNKGTFMHAVGNATMFRYDSQALIFLPLLPGDGWARG